MDHSRIRGTRGCDSAVIQLLYREARARVAEGTHMTRWITSSQQTHVRQRLQDEQEVRREPTAGVNVCVGVKAHVPWSPKSRGQTTTVTSIKEPDHAAKGAAAAKEFPTASHTLHCLKPQLWDHNINILLDNKASIGSEPFHTSFTSHQPVVYGKIWLGDLPHWATNSLRRQ